MTKLITIAFLLLLLLNVNISAQQKAKTAATNNDILHAPAGITKEIIRMAFGKNGLIEYNITTGTANISHGPDQIITGAYSAVTASGKTYTSKDYTTIKYTRQALTDAIGKGVKYIVELNNKNLPSMLQVFYTYPSADYFFIEVSLKGAQLRSNYMAPLIAGDVNIFASGDNRILFVPFDNDTFISYDAKSMAKATTNTSAEVGAFYENSSRKGLVIGSLEHTVWKTGIRTTGIGSKLSHLSVWGGYSDASVTRDTIPHGAISGNEIKSPKIFVGYFQDWRNGLEEYAKANRKVEKPFVFNWTKPTPFGWNSWGSIQQNLNYEKAASVADFFKDSLPAFRNGNTVYIDLDSYWDKLIKGGINGDLSQLKQFADHCKSAGLRPGIYWAPFADWGWKGINSGSRKMEGGDNYTYADAWTKTGGHYHNIDGARALDPTHPATRQRIALFISKFKECGFKMIKIDFLGHAAIESDHFYDTTVTTGMQAYRKGMEFLVSQLGSQMLIYAAISPNLATGRYAHIRRIACDAFKTIKDTRYTLNSVNYGWWQTYIYNHIDADHIVFGNEPEGVNRARFASGLITGSLITGDDYSRKGPWSQTAKELLQNKELLAIAKNGVAFKPVDGNSGDSTNDLFHQVIDGRLYLAVFNFTAMPKCYDIPFDRVGLDAFKKYDIIELFNDKPSKENGSLKFSLPGQDAVIYKIRL